MNKYTHIKEKLQNLKKVYMETAKAEFHAGIKSLFKENPMLQTVEFKAYTDFFNDGDSTNYNVHLDYPTINGYSEDYDFEEGNIWAQKDKVRGFYRGGKWTDEENKHYNESASKAFNELMDFLKSFDDEIYMDLFGDHVSIKITAEGIETEEYNDHD